MQTLLTLLLIAGNLFTVTLPQSVAAPVDAGVLAQMENYGTTIVYGHSDLVPFYDLAEGDVVQGVYADGSTKNYQVTQIGHYIAKSTEIAKRDGNLLLRIGRFEWMPMMQLILEQYSTVGGITFVTCYSGMNGHAAPTGRLFLELVPIGEDE